MNEKDVPLGDVVSAAEGLLDRTFILSTAKEHEILLNEMNALLALKNKGGAMDQAYRKAVVEEAQKIASLEWVSPVLQKSEKLRGFSQTLSELKLV